MQFFHKNLLPRQMKTIIIRNKLFHYTEQCNKKHKFNFLKISNIFKREKKIISKPMSNNSVLFRKNIKLRRKIF